MLTPIGKITFKHLRMAVLYNPNAKTAVVYYVYCRAMERRPCGIANDRSFKVTQILEELFSEYNTFVLGRFFK